MMHVHLISSASNQNFFKSHSLPNPNHALLSNSKHPQTSLSLTLRCSVKSGNSALTHQLLDEMPLSDTFAWNNLIHTHLTNEEPIAALSVYLHMLLRGARPDKHTFPRVLKASRLSSNLCLGKQLHAQGFKFGFSSDHYVIAALIDMYGRLDNADAAKSLLFDNSHSRRNNSVSWTVLVRSYLLQNKPNLAVHLFHQMMHFNVQVDSVALATAIGACGMLKSVQQGRNVHEIAKQCGLEFDILVSNSLMKMYIDCHSIEEARATFNQMPTKDIISWTEIMSGYMKIGEFNEALKLFRQMNITGLMKPDSLSICSILPACARPAAHKLGKQIHAYLLRNGIDHYVMVQNAVMDMYIKSGFIESASKIFIRMKERDVISWTVMILGFGLHGQGEIGVKLFRKLEKEASIDFDQFTYAAVLRCCITACMVEEGKFYFHCIKEPNVAHYALIVALLARAALFNEARAFIEDHQVGGYAEVLRALLDGCQIHQHAKMAKQVIEQLCELEPLNAENHMLLANWYTGNAEWEMVGKLKEKIKGMDLKIKEVYSWIEYRNKVHTFATGDLSHPRSERIYGEIQCLLKEIEVKAHGGASLFNIHDLEEERNCIQIKHSEMLAISFGLISTQTGATIRVVKNHRVCQSCHEYTKIISKKVGREIIMKDPYCFHHFKDGVCSCRDFW